MLKSAGSWVLLLSQDMILNDSKELKEIVHSKITTLMSYSPSGHSPVWLSETQNIIFWLLWTEAVELKDDKNTIEFMINLFKNGSFHKTSLKYVL